MVSVGDIHYGHRHGTILTSQLHTMHACVIQHQQQIGKLMSRLGNQDYSTAWIGLPQHWNFFLECHSTGI